MKKYCQQNRIGKYCQQEKLINTLREVVYTFILGENQTEELARAATKFLAKISWLLLKEWEQDPICFCGSTWLKDAQQAARNALVHLIAMANKFSDSGLYIIAANDLLEEVIAEQGSIFQKNN